MVPSGFSYCLSDLRITIGIKNGVLTSTSTGVKASTTPTDFYKIYPNPTSNVFKIKSINSDETFEKVEIMDGEGRVLLSKQNVNQQTEFDMSKFARGAYLVKLKTKTQVVTLKLFTISEQ